MKNLLFLFILCSLMLSSCKEQYVKVDDPQLFFKLRNSKVLTEVSILNQIKSNLSGVSILKSANSGTDSFDITNATISDYYGTDVMSIVIPVNEELSYVTYTDGKLVMKDGMFIKIEKCEDKVDVSFLDINMELIGSMNLVDGVIVNIVGATDHKILKSALTTNSFWSGFSKCVGVTLSRFTDGSTLGTATGLMCLAFGPECAAGVAVSCAVFADKYELMG